MRGLQQITMHKKRSAIAIIFALIICAGCGYTVAGLDGEVRGRYYIEAMRNSSNDMTLTRQMRQDITKFFLNYGALEERENAQYILIITLTEKNVDYAIRSDTREALSSDLIVTYHIQAEDSMGRLVYNRSISRSQKFTTGANIQNYRKNEMEAFEELTTEIFTAFKHDFESS